MKLSEAYNILGVQPNADPEAVKKQYKKLTREFHPDINKEAGAEEKFKKINEAYQVVTSGKEEGAQIPWQGFNPFANMDPFGMNQQVIHPADPVSLHINISFKDSILGCKKELKFNRKIKCTECQGNGKTVIPSNCTECQGKGRKVVTQGHMTFVTTCNKCYGKVETKNCVKCNSQGTLTTDTAISVNVPGGIQNGNILRLSHMGNFITTFGPLDQYSDAHLSVSVEADPELSLHGTDVVCTVSIPLVQAITGTSKTVRTILGSQEVMVPAKSKHKDEIILTKLGVNGVGNQKVVLHVDYPEFTDSMIQALQEVV
jgi:molecular chaperone DnaJ